MFFFINDEQLKSKLEMKETDREIKASFEDKTDDPAEGTSMEDDTTEPHRRPSLGELVSRYEREAQEAMKAYRTKAEALRRKLAEAERRYDDCRKERENARLRDAIGHFCGECAELVQQPPGTAPTAVVAQHNYYPGSLHVSGSHLPDARFTPAPTGHELTRK